MIDDLSYFTGHGPITDPGPYGDLLDRLPEDMAALCRLVQGTNLHIFWAERYGCPLPEERQAEVQLRTMQRRLGRLLELDPAPLTEARPLQRRLVGNCRDFSVMLACLLRQQGVPARARCGFGAYFLPGHFEDHWVCEYWNASEGRWKLADAQLDEFQCSVLGIQFDPLDVPRDQFLTGGRAWRMCRSGQADAERFGIWDMHGLWFIRGDLLRDVAALNKMELLPWDCWGMIERADDSISEQDFEILDLLAEMTWADVPDFDVLRRLYESDARLRVPGEVHSHTRDGVLTESIAVAA